MFKKNDMVVDEDKTEKMVWGWVDRWEDYVRRERLRLYLAEYVWRFNNGGLSIDQQVKKFMKLLSDRRLVRGRNGT